MDTKKIYARTTEYYSAKKEQNNDSCYNVEESQEKSGK